MDELEWIGHLRYLQDKGADVTSSMFKSSSPPSLIKPVPRLHDCLRALTRFFESPDPPTLIERSKHINLIIYGFADASEGGLGATLDFGDKVSYRVGVWGRDTEKESSNWRELANIVTTLEEQLQNDSIRGSTIIIATDNAVAEAAIYKGNSSSEKLFDLVVRLRELELKSSANIIVTHVSGERMKAQGTDGVSRGSLREGINIKGIMLDFCPWHLAPTQSSSKIFSFFKSVAGDHLELLKPSDWFSRGHDHLGGNRDSKGFWRPVIQPGIFLWDLPAGAAISAIEELRKARTKRRSSTHLVIVPRVATPLWLKQLYKRCDIVLFIPPHFSFWPHSCYEPLTLGFCFPYLRHYPWELGRTPKCRAMERNLRSLFKNPNIDPRTVLRQLFRDVRGLYTMPPRLLQRVLFFGQRAEISCEDRKRRSVAEKIRNRSSTTRTGLGSETPT